MDDKLSKILILIICLGVIGNFTYSLMNLKSNVKTPKFEVERVNPIYTPDDRTEYKTLTALVNMCSALSKLHVYAYIGGITGNASYDKENAFLEKLPLLNSKWKQNGKVVGIQKSYNLGAYHEEQRYSKDAMEKSSHYLYHTMFMICYNHS